MTLLEKNILEGGLDDQRVIDLLHFHFTTNRSLSPPESCHVFDLSRLKEKDVRFWSLWEGESLLSVGALKFLDQAHGEVKSMHTAKERRGNGAGSEILQHIIAYAQAQKLNRLSLETGSFDYFKPAVALYKKHGFIECAPFADYKDDPNSLFLTLAL